ncbi:ankyrin repeat-containing protein BDA1-like [Syzygium oleosum]|uniref:ankyrin repeat-containing protein BDA1-like n=1 Tax=Syzygium oleosum TaxID=219896 RepID=UPI0011D27FEA|nr:ankyrin repeat-containing protein BDA1-like [Syzygium oleosum]
MDPRLQLAIANDDVAELHSLLVEEPKLLDRLSKDPFPNTPLHVAAAAGKTHLAMEMAILKPSFARKLDPNGYSPMHLALQHKYYRTVRALMTLDPKLIRVRGQGGLTPLHFVAGKEGDNEMEILAEFLSSCGSSIEDLTSRCETAVHVAVKSHSLKAFKVLFGWLKRLHLTKILDWKDENGNNVLHIAAFENQPEIIRLLIGHVNINEKNFEEKTALEIFKANPSFNHNVAKRLQRQICLARPFTPTLSLSQFFSAELTAGERSAYFFGFRDESARDMILLVSTLIATATYQAALSPPGGYWQENSSNPPANATVVATNSSSIAIEKPHEAGNMILSGSSLYVFTVFNGTAFFFSIGTIWAIAIAQFPKTFMVYFSMSILGLAYFISHLIEFPNSNEVAKQILEGFYGSLLTAALFLPVYVWAMHVRVLNRIDATRRHVHVFLGSKDRK